MAAPPDKSEISAPYPNPSNGVMRLGMSRLYDYVTTLLGLSGLPSDARIALGAMSAFGGDIGGALNENRATVAAHATTADIFGALGNSINFTGVATVETFPNATQAGAKRWLHCGAACSFVHSATLEVQGGASFTVEAGDMVLIEAITVSTFKATIFRKNGQTVVASGKPIGEIFTSADLVAPPGALALPTAPTPLSRTAYAKLFNRITFTGSGSITNGQKAVTAVTSAAPVFVGCPVAGPGIAAGTVVESIGSGTFTLSIAASATTENIALRFLPYGHGDGSTTFGMPWCAPDHTLVMGSGNFATHTVGENLAHSHMQRYSDGVNGSGGGQANLLGNIPTGIQTGSSGGAANLAAGPRTKHYIQYSEG